jgi:hypothetical protein
MRNQPIKSQPLCYALIMGVVVTGCSNTPTVSQPSFQAPIASTCPPEPASNLQPGKTEDLVFEGSSKGLSGMANSDRYLSYRFMGKAKQRLDYAPKDQNLCVWVYAPDLKIVQGSELPIDGKYTVQLAALRGSQNFDLRVSLAEEGELLSPAPTESSASFSRSDFPKGSCGDAMPTDPKDFPVSFYPVNLPNTVSNLAQAQAKFCGDAYVKRDKQTREKLVQVASFTSVERAESFANLVRTEIREARVGSETVYQSSSEVSN